MGCGSAWKAKEHCSAGVSNNPWMMWLVSSMLIGSLAMYRNDHRFITLAASSLLSSARSWCSLTEIRGWHAKPMLPSSTRRVTEPAFLCRAETSK